MKKVKKVMCTLLSVGVMFSFTPLSSYAMNNDVENSVGAKYIDNIEPGEVFDSGIYFIRKDCEVIQNSKGGNGIEINGRVKFIIGDNCSVKIKGGDGEGIVGGGAGVYVPEGSEFILDGEGKFEAKGGNGATGSAGGCGEDAKHEGGAVYDYMTIGAGGAGGNGGGGAGAGIGTPGGKGGLGGVRVSGDVYKTTSFNLYKGSKKGNNGKPGLGAEASGTFVLWGKTETNIQGGVASDSDKPSGMYGKFVFYKDVFGNYFNASGGAGGGAGGSGFNGACIGSGGAGGSGGGSGGVGCLSDASKYDSILGGGGAGGFGKSNGAGGHTWGINERTGDGREIHAPKDGEACFGGAGAELWYSGKKLCAGGHGGNSPKCNESAAGGKFYFDVASKQKTRVLKNLKDTFDGKEAQGIGFIKESDCKVETQGSIIDDNTFSYTGHEVQPKFSIFDTRTDKVIPKEAYEVFYSDNVNVGRAEMLVLGNEYMKKDIPVIVSDNKYDKSGNVIFPFDIRHETKLTGINVKSKKYDGKAIKPAGELKITYKGKDITKEIKSQDISFNYYKLTESGEEKIGGAPKEVGKYKLNVQVKNEKYAGMLGDIWFDITAK